MAEEEYILDLNKMKIADLRKELQERGLKVSGNKHDLIQRLQQYLEEHEGALVDEDDAAILGEEDDDEITESPPDIKEAEDKQPGTPVEDELPETSVAEQEVEAPPLIKSNLSDAEKKKLRAEKFGLKVSELSEDQRLANRSQRFGSSTSNGGSAKSITASGVPVDSDKLKKRQERFGTVSSTLIKSEAEERKRKRQERFGLSVTASATLDVDEKRKKRAERFGTAVV